MKVNKKEEWEIKDTKGQFEFSFQSERDSGSEVVLRYKDRCIAIAPSDLEVLIALATELNDEINKIYYPVQGKQQ